MADSRVPPPAALPPDDPRRTLTHVHADRSPGVAHIALAGDTYTILVAGADTAGRYCLIDMFVPHDGGPPPHRHDFEEMFTILEGEIEFTFRGRTVRAVEGDTVNIPANAPHSFRNASGRPARMLCMCTPAGQDEFFREVGTVVAGRTAPPPARTPEEEAETRRKAAELAPSYRTELPLEPTSPPPTSSGRAG